jgi:hypothetical protein
MQQCQSPFPAVADLSTAGEDIQSDGFEKGDPENNQICQNLLDKIQIDGPQGVAQSAV